MTKYEEALDKLTMKQRLFVEAYFASDYNATEAVRKAGYKSNGNENRMGHELLNKPRIKAAVQAKQDELVEQIKLKPEFVVRKLMSTIAAAEDERNHNAVLRGLELAARHLGMLTDKQEITGKDGEAIKYEEIKNEAADFTSSISRLIDRRGKGEAAIRAIDGGKG